jgi:hypothetical protein
MEGGDESVFCNMFCGRILNQTSKQERSTQMNARRYFVVCLAVGLVLTFLIGQTAAATDTFDVTVHEWGVYGGGTGYQYGQWFEYPQDTDMSWWNQWFYDDPLVQPGGKRVHLQFSYEPLDPAFDGFLEVTINWSTPEWSPNPDAPPLPEAPSNPEDFIERLIDYAGQYPMEPWTFIGAGEFDSGQFYLPIDYNPEWVSIDVRGDNMLITRGTLEHVCVPIPTGVWLLGSGLLGLVGIRRRLREVRP